ncbi:hypothetical protein ACFFJT_04275 [Dyella flava]|uniref:Uncharacterized protein n=1 Tax=Dyella flava TaxID=1920170 RepID=A0ABS2K5X4_9GAMM|nr:hypothetical protein [Dyella flava]MBM7126571.1 hypothetical protein [Dyella flava]
MSTIGQTIQAVDVIPYFKREPAKKQLKSTSRLAASMVVDGTIASDMQR